MPADGRHGYGGAVQRVHQPHDHVLEGTVVIHGGSRHAAEAGAKGDIGDEHHDGKGGGDRFPVTPEAGDLCQNAGQQGAYTQRQHGGEAGDQQRAQQKGSGKAEPGHVNNGAGKNENRVDRDLFQQLSAEAGGIDLPVADGQIAYDRDVPGKIKAGNDLEQAEDKRYQHAGKGQELQQQLRIAEGLEDIHRLDLKEDQVSADDADQKKQQESTGNLAVFFLLRSRADVHGGFPLAEFQPHQSQKLCHASSPSDSASVSSRKICSRESACSALLSCSSVPWAISLP